MTGETQIEQDGLVTATLLTMFVLPVVYALFGAAKNKSAGARTL